MSKNKTIFFDIDYTLFDTKSFKDSNLKNYQLYDEVIPVLRELQGNADLAIFSRGENAFQNEKLQQTQLTNFFPEDRRFIYDDKLQFLHILNSDNPVYLVDDKLSVLQKAKQKNPKIITVWIQRGPYAKEVDHIDEFDPDNTISDLNELARLIKIKD